MIITDCSWSAGFGAKWHGVSKVNTSDVTSLCCLAYVYLLLLMQDHRSV